MKRQENWIQNDRKKTKKQKEKQTNRILTCRSRAYYISAGQKKTVLGKRDIEVTSDFEFWKASFMRGMY